MPEAPETLPIGSRPVVLPSALRLHACPLPRPGDRVVWYQNRVKLSGVLLGHMADGRPVIQNDFGTFSTPPSYDVVRLADPDTRIGPNWTRLPEGAQAFQPSDSEEKIFSELLAQRTPPGPQYAELLNEIAGRGFEVFLVGGTVRDVISGAATHDVDLSTTMPLCRLHALVREMYGRPRTLEDSAKFNGHLRLGGRAGSGDPFIDLSVFKHSMLGTADAIFSDSFDFDVRNRDFACNSIYYDPLNRVYIDPTSCGVEHAEQRLLGLVADPNLRTPYQMGQIILRFFKFLSRGFTPTGSCQEFVHENVMSFLGAMDASLRIRYIRAQIISKASPSEVEEHFEAFRIGFANFGVPDVFRTFIEPLREEILR